MQIDNCLQNFFINHNIDPQSKFVLAVSTGVDSMVLLHQFMQLTTNIVVAHVNHGKREQSNIEEQFIKQFCDEHNIKCCCTKFEFKTSKDFQNEARKKRYDFFYQVANKTEAKYLVLAHHQDDNAETIIMKIMRSGSIESLGGMAPVGNYLDITILRPLLDVSKEQIIKYCTANNIKYFEDYTNALNLYTRNSIRHEVLPALTAIYPDVSSKLSQFAKQMRYASNLIKKIVDDFINRNVKTGPNISFSLSSFLSLDDFLRTELLFSLLKNHQLSSANISEVVKLITSDKQNIKTRFKNCFTFVKEYDTITFYDFLKAPLDCQITIDKIGKYYINDNISVNVMKKNDNTITKLNELWYNSEELPIIVRTKKTKDKIKVGTGYKKIKDLLIDEKVGIIRRDNLLLAEDSNNEILIAFGVKKSSLLKPDNTDIVICIEEKDNE